MVFVKSCVVFCALFVIIEAAKLPEYFPKCKKDAPIEELGKCIVDRANNGLKKLQNGEPSIHVMPIDPAHVPRMLIDVEGNLKIDITDADINGVSDGVMNEVLWDVEKKHVELKFTVPRANLQGTYDIDGRILILPINGKGPCNITFVEGDYVLSFEYDIEEKGSKQYIKISSNKMTYTLKRAYFGLENLFGGDKRLGEEMKKFLDENWKEVNGEIGTRVGDALGEVFATIIQGMFSRVPIDELFE